MSVIGHVDEISRSGVTGWAADTESMDQTVAVSILVDGVHRGMCLASEPRTDLVLPNGQTMNGDHGFSFVFDPPLSPFVEMRIDVIETWTEEVLPNGSRLLPRPRVADAGTGMMPILLTSTGRTGTTMLMSEFARHPDIVIGDRFPYEIKQIAYHAAAFRALAATGDRQRSTVPETMLAPEQQYFIGSNPFNTGGLFGLGGDDASLRRFYQDTMPSELATSFRRLIVEFYATLAASQGKQIASCFCEKADIDEAAAQGARLFFDTVRDIVIVRDPRDLLCSAIAFWKLEPGKAMNMLSTTVPRLDRIAREAGPDTIVIRYEDLVRAPVATRRALSGFLDLDLSGPSEAAAAAIPDSHRTSRDASSSIGRWRRDLTIEQIRDCEVAFGSYMRDFDYELNDTAGVAGAGCSGFSWPGRREKAINEILAAEGALAAAAYAEQCLGFGEDGHRVSQVYELMFGRDGSGAAVTGEGWSRPESGYVWSHAPEASVLLPPIRRDGAYRLHIVGAPFTHGEDLPAQRVMLSLAGQSVVTALLRDVSLLSIPISPAVASSGEPVALTLRFPDAARPSEVLGSKDIRLLGFSLQRLALFRREEPMEEAAQPVPRRSYSGRGVTEGIEDAETDDDTVQGRITSLAREAFRRPDLRYHGRTRLAHIPGYDANGFVRLILGVEAAFAITLPEHDVDRIATLGDLVAAVASKLS